MGSTLEEQFMFDMDTCTDLTVRDIIDAEANDLTQQRRALDKEIILVCNQLGICAEDIPVDENGYITSPVLVTYAKFWMYHTLLSDFWWKKDDVYENKLKYYSKQMNNTYSKINLATVLDDTLLRSQNIQQKVIY